MKSLLRLSICLSLLLSICACTIKTNAQGVGNHFTMSLMNCSLVSPDTIQFDLMIMSDGVASSSMRLNSCQYGVNFDTSILPSGSFYSTSFVNGSSDLMPLLQPFTFTPSSFLGHIRITQGVYTGKNVWGQGVVNVSSDTVILVSGDHFICTACGRSNIQSNTWDTCYTCSPTFTLIVLNGSSVDTIGTVLDSLHLLLMHPVSSALTGVTYSVTSPLIANPMITGYGYKAGTFRLNCYDTLNSMNIPVAFVPGVSNGPNFSLQSATAGGHTVCAAIAYIDTAVSTTAFSATGTGNGQRSDTVECNLIILSAKDLSSNAQLDIFPNPVQDRFTVSGLSTSGATTIDVFNILGTKIYSESLTNAGKQETINCKLVAGMYFVRINNGGRQYVRKIVVQ